MVKFQEAHSRKIKNVFICKKCNSSKGSKRLYEWFGYKNRDEIPSIAEGKYLKLIYKLHKERGTLDIHRHLLQKLCLQCDMEEECIRIGREGKLTVYCLEGIFKK